MYFNFEKAKNVPKLISNSMLWEEKGNHKKKKKRKRKR